jgi:hypothetical protein
MYAQAVKKGSRGAQVPKQLILPKKNVRGRLRYLVIGSLGHKAHGKVITSDFVLKLKSTFHSFLLIPDRPFSSL